MAKKVSADAVVKDIRRKAHEKYSAEEKPRFVLEGLRGESSIAELCRREGIPANLYYRWSKNFLRAAKKRLMGDTIRLAMGSTCQVSWELLSDTPPTASGKYRLLSQAFRGDARQQDGFLATAG